MIHHLNGRRYPRNPDELDLLSSTTRLRINVLTTRSECRPPSYNVGVAIPPNLLLLDSPVGFGCGVMNIIERLKGADETSGPFVSSIVQDYRSNRSETPVKSSFQRFVHGGRCIYIATRNEHGRTEVSIAVVQGSKGVAGWFNHGDIRFNDIGATLRGMGTGSHSNDDI